MELGAKERLQMKAIELKIHNFRSICDATITLDECSILVGANNSGKSATIDAVRAFYGKGAKFDKSQDFPRRGSTDTESWVELEFKPSKHELASLKDEYKTADGTFRVRNYLYSEQADDEGKPKSGPFAYVKGALSGERFYGFKNVGQGKFGEVIYIPAVSRVDEHTKLTGPSALRDLVNSVLSIVVEQSEAYKALSSSFDVFEGAIKAEETGDGYSIQSIEDDISAELAPWGTGFRLNIKPVGVDDIIKGLIGHEIFDDSLESAQPISSYGQGFQRSVIYTLIRIAAKYSAKKGPKTKKDFSPELTWILFEEPEAFLHPTQISVLSSDLRSLASRPTSQVLISTHNPQFATHSIRNIPAICRLQKEDCQTTLYQISADQLDAVLAVNQQDLALWVASGITLDADDLSTDMEAIKYALWLDSKRSSAFFSEKVLLVEGPTEVSLLAYMVDKGLLPACQGVFILDTIGKYNMHRFMNLFGHFGIKHYVLFDGDNGRQHAIEATINAARNRCTGGVDTFPNDLEEFLGIPRSSKPHRKPQHVMLRIGAGTVDLKPLAEKISALVS
jgi:putative ATP-dependent endonuclease of OLD family